MGLSDHIQFNGNQGLSEKEKNLRDQRISKGLCPECGGEIVQQIVKEITADPNAHPIKSPAAVIYGGWEIQRNCSCGEQFFAWTETVE